MARRCVSFASRAEAETALRELNTHYLKNVLPLLKRRGDKTLRYLPLSQWADGTWGFEVDDFVRTLDGVTVGAVKLDLSAERGMPTRDVTIAGETKAAAAAAVTDEALADAPKDGR